MSDDLVQAAHDANFAHLSGVLSQSNAGRFTRFWNLGFRGLPGDAGTQPAEGNARRSPVRDARFNRDAERLASELVAGIELVGKAVLDIGCGRGGATTLYEALGANPVFGLDRSWDAVKFGRYGRRVVVQADACGLPIKDASVDVVTNLESSQFYAKPDRFYTECARVLRSAGLFCYGDSFPADALPAVRRLISSAGFSVATERDVTENVLESRRAVAGRQARALANDQYLANFSGGVGERIFDDLQTRRYVYVLFRLRRDVIAGGASPDDIATVRAFASKALEATGVAVAERS